MAFVSRLSDYVGQGVAAQEIAEGMLVTTTISGTRGNLPNVVVAASGTVRPVFVAFVPPDNFARPVNSLQYTATELAVLRSDLNTGWNLNQTDTYTMYRIGLSNLEAPTLVSGMLVQLHRQGTYTLTSGNFISSAQIKVNGALVKVADDGTGKFAYTTNNSVAVGFVEEYDAYRNYLVVTLF